MFEKYIGKYIEFKIINFLSIPDIFNYMFVNKRIYYLLNDNSNKTLYCFEKENFIKNIIHYLKYNKMDRINWCIQRKLNFNKNILLSMALLFTNNVNIIIFIIRKYGFYGKDDLEGIEYFIIYLMKLGIKHKAYNTTILIKKINKKILSKNQFLNDLLINIFIKKEFQFPIVEKLACNNITKKIFFRSISKYSKKFNF